jgi:hypothetical protein
LKFRKVKYIIFISIIITYIVITIGCTSGGNNDIVKDIDKIVNVSTYIHSNFEPINFYSNQAKHYCMINDKHYFDLNVMSEDGTINKISDNIPYGNPFNANIYGIATDGEYLYCHAWNLQINKNLANERKLGLYKIDVNKKTVEPLYEWETPDYISNSYSITFEGEYIYFFMSIGNTNDLCRIKKDGTDFEKLTNNKEDTIYNGIFFVNDQVFYHKNSKLYKTTINNIDSGIMIYENLYTIELYKGYFYCTTPSLYNECYEFIRIKADAPTAVELLINDMCGDSYIIKDDIIYYAKYDPIVIAKNSQGLETKNSSQGQIYMYNINTKENKKLFQNREINFDKIYNINDTSIIARANTNTQLIDSAEQGGLYIDYYIIPLDGSEAYHIKDLTLNLVGT